MKKLCEILYAMEQFGKQFDRVDFLIAGIVIGAIVECFAIVEYFTKNDLPRPSASL